MLVVMVAAVVKIKDMGVCINCFDAPTMIDSTFCSVNCGAEWRASGGKTTRPTNRVICSLCNNFVVPGDRYCAEHREEMDHVLDYEAKKRAGLLKPDERFFPYYMKKHYGKLPRF